MERYHRGAVGSMARVVRALLIAWLIVVVGTSAWTAVRGRRLYVVARTAQAGIDEHMAASRVHELPERLTELEAGECRYDPPGSAGPSRPAFSSRSARWVSA